MPTAKRTTDFLNTIGVNTHISQGYGTAAENLTALQYFGARIMRDNIGTTGSVAGDAGLVTAYKQVAAGGVKLCLVAMGTPVNIPNYIRDVKNIATAYPGMLLACEGFNEPNNQLPTYQGVTCVNGGNFAPCINAMNDLYSAIRAEPTLNASLVYDLSETNGNGQPQLADIVYNGVRHADVANEHCYPRNGGQQWGPAVNTTDNGVGFWSFGYPTIATQLVAATIPGTQTEFGWYTANDSAEGVSQRAQSLLTMNTYLGNFQHGLVSSFYYTILDEPTAQDIAEQNYGVFFVNNTPKPTATHMHNLTTILADNAANAATFTPGALAYTLSGMPALGRNMLMQKAGGALQVVLWNDAVVYTASTNTDVFPAASTVTVALGATYGTVNVYDPTVGTAATRTLSNVSSLTVSLVEHPMIVEVLSGAVNVESASGTQLTTTTGAIYDAGLNAFTLVPAASGLGVAYNGTLQDTSDVVLGLYYNHAFYQENSLGNWYLWNGTTYVASADPRPAVAGTSYVRLTWFD